MFASCRFWHKSMHTHTSLFQCSMPACEAPQPCANHNRSNPHTDTGFHHITCTCPCMPALVLFMCARSASSKRHIAPTCMPSTATRCLSNLCLAKKSLAGAATLLATA
jgi:hypothetical protein